MIESRLSRSCLLLLLLLGAGTVRGQTLTRTLIDANRDGKADTLSVEMTHGRRFVDSEAWCGNGEKYEGSFAFVVDFQGKRVETSVDSLLGVDSLWFHTEPWQLAVSDYNGDGRMEFNLGQYASCVGWDYWMFAIRPSGTVDLVSGRFMVADFVASTDKLMRVPNGFRAEQYDRVHGRNVEITFRWDSDDGMFEYESTAIAR